MDKVYIPVKEFPEINFIGLLIGPRGNTLKKMETESGAKISIRGKGSVKEGKSRSDSASSSNLEEDLHCLVSADTEEKVAKAIQLINKIIETVRTSCLFLPVCFPCFFSICFIILQTILTLTLFIYSRLLFLKDKTSLNACN